MLSLSVSDCDICDMADHGLSQDLENWVPKIGNYKVSGHPVFSSETTTMIYLLIEIRNNILQQCHGSYIGVKIAIIC